MQYFAQPGDTVVSASSDYLLLSAYAVRGASGAIRVLVINKDTTASLNAQVALSGFLPGSATTIFSYGISQDEAARTNGTSEAQDLAMTNLPAASADSNYSFPPLSLTLFTFAPTAPRLAMLPPGPEPGGQLILQLQGQAGVRYAIETSTDLTAWTPISTNTLSGTTLDLTIPVPAGTAINFWRARWQP
jgi:hypothetical protein